jgi:hypothetical protein
VVLPFAVHCPPSAMQGKGEPRGQWGRFCEPGSQCSAVLRLAGIIRVSRPVVHKRQRSTWTYPKRCAPAWPSLIPCINHPWWGTQVCQPRLHVPAALSQPLHGPAVVCPPITLLCMHPTAPFTVCPVCLPVLSSDARSAQGLSGSRSLDTCMHCHSHCCVCCISIVSPPPTCRPVYVPSVCAKQHLQTYIHPASGKPGCACTARWLAPWLARCQGVNHPFRVSGGPPTPLALDVKDRRVAVVVHMQAGNSLCVPAIGGPSPLGPGSNTSLCSNACQVTFRAWGGEGIMHGRE